MKFLLILQGAGDPRLRRDEFERAARDAGELVAGEQLADPQLSIQFPTSAPNDIDGYYVIDVDSRDRAVELALLLPDSRAADRSVEIRALMHPAGTDF
jgi:hypothetical protein